MKRAALPVTATRRCGQCGHAFHRDQCPRKGPSGCETMLNPATGRPTGIACARGRWPCPCPWGECHGCDAPITGATLFPLDSGADEVDIDRGSAGAPDGTLAWPVGDYFLDYLRLLAIIPDKT